MASKKPAKPQAGQNRTAPVLDPAIYGVQVKYAGMKSAPMVCSQCKKTTVTGMVRIKGDNMYCSPLCAKKD